MNASTSYFASTLGHALVLGLLLALTSLQRPQLFVPEVSIVSLPSGGGAGKGALRAVRPPPAAVAPPVPKVEDELPAPRPKEKKEKEKHPTPLRHEPKPAKVEGVRPATEAGVVSKSKGVPGVKPKLPLAAAAAAAAGTAAGPGTGRGAGPGPDHGGVGIETEGEGGAGAWYLALLRDRIASAWTPPPAIGRNGEASASVHFYLGRAGGNPDRVEVRQSSQVAYFDRAALRAVLDAAPLPPLPREFGSDPTGFTLLFKQEY